MMDGRNIQILVLLEWKTSRNTRIQKEPSDIVRDTPRTWRRMIQPVRATCLIISCGHPLIWIVTSARTKNDSTCRMSYPGATGYPTNLACETSLQRSTDAFLFQLNTGAGTGPASSLQSPATILPGDDGSTSLSLVTTTGANGAQLAVEDLTGNTALISIATVEGGTANLLMGTAAGVAFAAYSGAQEGQLTITGQASGITVANFDCSNNTVALGSTLAPGSVTVNGPLKVANAVLPANANQLILSSTSSSASSIVQSKPSVGTLSIGSSAANSDAITIADNGPNTFTTIKNLAPPIIANNKCTIAGYVNQIPNGTSTLVLPFTPTPGIYWFAVNITDSTPRYYQVNTMVYYSGTAYSTGGGCISGGSTQMGLQPSNDETQMTVSWAGGTIGGYVTVVPLFNVPIPSLA